MRLFWLDLAVFETQSVQGLAALPLARVLKGVNTQGLAAGSCFASELRVQPGVACLRWPHHDRCRD